MHLIDTRTLELRWFSGSPPPYAILSHTWGAEEMTFADFNDLLNSKAKAGFSKIKSTCKQALQHGLHYAWVDTCCINKESSSELSEAINCMFRWYRDAAICYAYLEDLSGIEELPTTDLSPLGSCKWFTRGWTLQELLAPPDIVFFQAEWIKIGRKAELTDVLELVTGIPSTVLTGSTRLSQVSVADRMNWAAKRQTTREEDIAYCLMGIFDVNMPMMYGEGRKAYIRLQEEILKQTQDDSLFAWSATEQSASMTPYRGLFASSPKEFASKLSIKPFYTSMAGGTTLLGNGQVSLSCARYQDGFLGLKCIRGTDVASVVAIEVINTGYNQFLRTNPSRLILKAHKYPASFDTVVFEKFTELQQPSSLDDIFQQDAVNLVGLPQEIRLKMLYPKEYQSPTPSTVLPMVYVVGKKVAFELVLSEEATGANILRRVGWAEKYGLRSEENDANIILVLWVEKSSGTNPYECYFSLEKVGPRGAESTFTQARRPQEAFHQNELSLGWSVFRVHGRFIEDDGRRAFNLNISFTVNESVKDEARAIRIKQEAIRERERGEARAIRVEQDAIRKRERDKAQVTRAEQEAAQERDRNEAHAIAERKKSLLKIYIIAMILSLIAHLVLLAISLLFFKSKIHEMKWLSAFYMFLIFLYSIFGAVSSSMALNAICERL